MFEIESTIAGIPCVIKVSHFRHKSPEGPRADSADDCYGYTEVEFDVCDRGGRAAPWLVRKMTQVDADRIREQIIEECLAP